MLIEDYVYDSYNKPLHLTKQVLRGDKFKFAVIQ
jgi:GntR family transcriptional regulator